MRTRPIPGPTQTFIVDELASFTAPELGGAAIVSIDINQDVAASTSGEAVLPVDPTAPSPNRHQRRAADAIARRSERPGRRRN